MRTIVKIIVMIAVMALLLKCETRETKKPPVIVTPPTEVEYNVFTKFELCEQDQNQPCILKNSTYQTVYATTLKKGDTVFTIETKEIVLNGKGAWWSTIGETTFLRINTDGIVDAVVKCN